MGYIYFVHDIANRAVKIGATYNPKTRIPALRIASASTLTLIRVVDVDDCFDVEHRLHIQFGHLRIRGEWFRATPELLDFAQNGDISEWNTPKTQSMVSVDDVSYSLNQLSDVTGVSARTIRYYIAEQVLRGPCRHGRGACYTQEHVNRIKDIQRLQTIGCSLDDIRRMNDQPLPLDPPVEFLEHQVAPGVKVAVKKGVSPWRMHLIEHAIRTLRDRLSEDDDSPDEPTDEPTDEPKEEPR